MTDDGWRQYTLGEVVTLQRGFDITKKEQVQGPHPVISSSGINSYHNAYKIKGPGVVVGRKGSLGTVFYVEENYWPHDTTLWVNNFHDNIPRFCYYFLKTMQLERFDSGAANPTLNRNHIHSLLVRIPSVPIQKKITEVLGAFDDLVEVNLRRIGVLEELARGLYDEWFVRLRFPAHEDTEITQTEHGPTPKGWKNIKLGGLADEIRESTSPEDIDPATPYVGLAHIPQKTIALSDWGKIGETKSTKLRFKRNDILFAKIRPYLHKVAVAPLDGASSSDTIIIRPKKEENYSIVLYCVSSDNFVAFADKTSKGTQMPRTDWKILRNYNVLHPPEEILTQFNALVRNNVQLIQNLIFQNKTLSSVRNIFLPKLISGEIDISNMGIAV